MDYKSIIESAYDRRAWQTLLHDIFGDKVSFYEPPHLLSLDKALITHAWFLGSITLDNGQKLGIYEAELNHVDLERNRVGIRNLLTTEWRNRGFVGAFQFCYTSGSSELRFSYASETWGFDKENKFRKESTDTHRYTYFLGAGHRNRTAIDQFKKLKASDLTLQDITEAFSIEAVSKRFFDDYKRNYEDVVEYVTGKRMVKVGGKWQEKATGKGEKQILAAFASFDNPEKAVRDYVKKLMGRIVFLQFLQKKGWLGVPVGAKWGEGDGEFLRHLFDANQRATFIDDILERLFDDINTRREGDLANSVLGRGIRVPYLNGGLFERDAADAVDFPLPVELLTRLFDFFGAYNFTIDENDPEDAEVGVDPEMLSRIFENLLEDNKDKGAFYTPKSIVGYMCRESLSAYLNATDFVKSHNASALSPAVKADLLQKLREVKICDPAIGSGAFPMGLLKELFACRKALGDPKSEFPSELKKDIIENNIYGVDIEKGAVDIARLRFWLALVVDETSPHALPNLDFKIMQGNSLLESFGGVPLDHVLEGGSAAVTQGKYKGGKKAGQKRNDYWQITFAFDAQEAIKEIVRDKNALFNETDHEVKKLLINRINKNVKQFISSKLDTDSPWQAKIPDGQNDQFFLWHVWFSDVFSRPGKSGFDIVIGNPPYFRYQAVHVGEIEKLSCQPDLQTAKGGKLNAYKLFLAKALSTLCCEHGLVSFIFQNSFLADVSALKLRKDVFENRSIRMIDSFPERDCVKRRVFESVKMSVCIVLIQNEHVSDRDEFYVNIWNDRDKNVGYTTAFSVEEIKKLSPEALAIPSISLEAKPLIIKMLSQKNLEVSCIEGELNVSFCRSYFTDIKANPVILKGASVQRYYITNEMSQGEIEYLDEERYQADCGRSEKSHHHEHERIAMQGITGVNDKRRLIMTLIPSGYYLANSCNYIVEKDQTLCRYKLGLLNSNLFNWFFKAFSTNSNVNGYEVDRMPLKKENAIYEEIVNLVDAILAAKKADPEADTAALEDEIDQIVYKLYGLTDDEITVVEKAVKK